MVAALLALLAAGCAGGSGQPTDEPSEQTSSQSATPPGESITGTFGGDAQLEGGCAWIDDGKTRWNVQYPEGYRVTFDPVRLNGPEGATAKPGDTVTVEGSEQRDVMTTCQIGPVFAATSVSIEP